MKARSFDRRILIVGCGAVGQGLLPVLFRTFDVAPSQLTVIAADGEGSNVCAQWRIRHVVAPITPENFQTVLPGHLKAGDLLLNLSVHVSSLALIAWCKAHEVLYLDTCVEPWRGGYVANDVTASNAWLRRQALALHTPGAATAVIAHGMNPGLISHLAKEALLALARRNDVEPLPEWGALAQALGVKAIHISERDTQDDGFPLPHGVFANTWSARGLHSEACLQRAELEWGSHEPAPPAGAIVVKHGRAQIVCLPEPGAQIWLKSWTPSQGEQRGMLVTHHEVASIGDWLATDTYRPTVCYVYRPCPKAGASLSSWRAGKTFREFRVLPGSNLRGADEIGILLIHDHGALWHGSILDCSEARRVAPHNNATTLQVAAGIVGAIAWMQDHPRAGVVEAENMDSAQVLAVARPYLGRVATFETGWRPGKHLTLDEFLADESGQGDTAAGYTGAPENLQEAVV
jgi:homospermidine synthase